MFYLIDCRATHHVECIPSPWQRDTWNIKAVKEMKYLQIV